MDSFSDDQIFNADECDFNKEMSLGLTLDIKGTSKVHGAVLSKGPTTYSYTIMLVVYKAED